MALDYQLVAQGSALSELRDRSDAIESELSGLPSGTRLELRLQLRRVEFGGRDWTQTFVEGAASIINAADGLAAWVEQLFGRRLAPWPGQTDLAFVWVDDATGDWVLALRWVTSSAWVAAVVRFLLQVTVVIAAGAAVVWLADAVAGWAIHVVRERAEQAVQELWPIVALAAAGYIAWHVRRKEAERRG